MGGNRYPGQGDQRTIGKSAETLEIHRSSGHVSNPKKKPWGTTPAILTNRTKSKNKSLLGLGWEDEAKHRGRQPEGKGRPWKVIQDANSKLLSPELEKKKFVAFIRQKKPPRRETPVKTKVGIQIKGHRAGRGSRRRLIGENSYNESKPLEGKGSRSPVGFNLPPITKTASSRKLKLDLGEVSGTREKNSTGD